jgi:serine/threonine protein kinase
MVEPVSVTTVVLPVGTMPVQPSVSSSSMTANNIPTTPNFDSTETSPISLSRSRIRPFQRTNSKLTCKQEVPIIPSFHLHIQQCLGKGAFSSVYKVNVLTPTIATVATTTITTKEPEDPSQQQHEPHPHILRHEPTMYHALKCLNSKFMSPSRRRSATLDQSMEADLLSRLDHDNIIKLYGVTCSRACHSPACANSATYCEKHHNNTDHDKGNDAENHPNHGPLLEGLGHCLVLELLHETLQDRLVAWRRRSCGALILHPRFRMGLYSSSALRHRLETVVMGIIKGMVYLHSQNVLVRDLKPANIGFDSHGTVKLFDFGLARELHECNSDDEGGVAAGSLRYLAPERLLVLPLDDSINNKTPISLSSDVYSLGVLMWEICTLQKPYNEYRTVSAFKEHVVQQQERPCLQGMIPSRLLQESIGHCWDPYPTNRPSLVQVQANLETKLSPRPKAYSSRLAMRKDKHVATFADKQLDANDPDDSRPPATNVERKARHLLLQRQLKVRHLGGLVPLNSSRRSLTSCTESVTYHSSSHYSFLHHSGGSMMSPGGWDSLPSQAAITAGAAEEEDLFANLVVDAWISRNEESLDLRFDLKEDTTTKNPKLSLQR